MSGNVTTEGRRYISSRAGADARAVHDAVRGHAAVENQLHRQLDVSFIEDRRRIRKGHGATTLAGCAAWQ